MEYFTSIKKQQHTQLLKILNDEKYVDTTLLIGPLKQQYRIHRLFLSSISEDFQKLLSNDNKNEYVIPNIDTSGLECVLNYAYLGNPNLNHRNVLSTIHICKDVQQYPIPSLVYSFPSAIGQYTPQISDSNNVI